MKPQKLQSLKHNRILSRGAFPGFVETWNWICRVICSWVGDRENGGDGFIYVDRANEDIPVIRLDYTKLARRLGKGKGEGDANSLWRIVSDTAEAEYTDPETGETDTVSSDFHYLDNQYYQVGGMLFKGEDRTTLESFVEDGKPFIAARIVFGGGAFNVASLVGYASFAAMQADSLDRRWSIIPLYELEPPPEPEEGEEDPPVQIVVKTDFRTMPLVQAFEMPLEGGVV